jgi:uncharacterized membrane protein YeaQ/YmgE (transglycosylase-associated protein family)
LIETAQEVFAYLQGGAVVALALAFVAGLAAVKTVAYERRSGVVVFLVVGILGLFLGEFVLLYFGLDEYLENISELRILVDLIAAYLGSFFIAAIVHFIKPT